MKRNLSIRKIAASALLVSSLAASSVFADEAPGKMELRPAAATPIASVSLSIPGVNLLQSVSLSIPSVDLLQLAETYAPESLEDWKQTLEEYRKAVSVLIHTPASGAAAGSDRLPLRFGQVPDGVLLPSLHISEIKGTDGVYAVKGGIDLAQEAGQLELTKGEGAIQIRAIPVESVEQNEQQSNIVWTKTIAQGGAVTAPAKIFSVETALTEIVPAEAVTTGAVPFEAVPFEAVQLGAVPAEAMPARAFTATVAAAEAGSLPFLAINGDDLLQAVESQDNDAIRDALSRQLQLYKEKIAELTAGFAPEAEQPAADDNE